MGMKVQTTAGKRGRVPGCKRSRTAVPLVTSELTQGYVHFSVYSWDFWYTPTGGAPANCGLIASSRGRLQVRCEV